MEILRTSSTCTRKSGFWEEMESVFVPDFARLIVELPNYVFVEMPQCVWVFGGGNPESISVGVFFGRITVFFKWFGWKLFWWK